MHPKDWMSLIVMIYEENKKQASGVYHFSNDNKLKSAKRTPPLYMETTLQHIRDHVHISLIQNSYARRVYLSHTRIA